MADPTFWDNQETAQKVINENNDLKAKYDTFHQLNDKVDELLNIINDDYDSNCRAINFKGTTNPIYVENGGKFKGGVFFAFAYGYRDKLELPIAIAYNEKDVDISLIPYYAWGNRKLNKMRVWLPEE